MADPTPEQWALAEALDDLTSERGVTLDDDRLDWLAAFVDTIVAERLGAAWDEGYMRGQHPFREAGESDLIPSGVSPPTWGKNANPYRPEFVLADPPDWMLRCDGCGVDYPAHADLLGAGDEGKVEARRRAGLNGWTSAPGRRDYCPGCASEFVCLTCGPTSTEPHPRRSGVIRCANCKEQLRCARCGGLNGSHGFVHTRHGNGGGSNAACPLTPAPEASASSGQEASHE